MSKEKSFLKISGSRADLGRENNNNLLFSVQMKVYFIYKA